MTDRLLRALDELIEQGSALARKAANAGDYLIDSDIEQLTSVGARSVNVARQLAGEDSDYANAVQRIVSIDGFARVHGSWYTHVIELVGILKGLRDDVANGLLADLRQLLRGEVFTDFIEMAEHLLQEGYKDASAVLAGGVLEDALRKLAVAHGIATELPSGKPLTIDPLNIALAKSGVYGALAQKQITSWASLRNAAAHGKYTTYDQDDVRHMLQFVQKFCYEYMR